MQGIGEDIFIEVSHGPTLIDHNMLLSTRSLKLATQGVAMVHNLIAGSFAAVGKGTDNGAKTLRSPRYTPYHVPHRTEVAGFMTFLHGDARFYNNVFIQLPVHPALVEHGKQMRETQWDDGNTQVGVYPYDGYPTFDEWKAEFEGYCGMGSQPSDRYYIHLPVWSKHNLFLNGAKPWDKEEGSVCADRAANVAFDGEKLSADFTDMLAQVRCAPLCTDDLGMAFEPEEKFENPDGTPISFDTDFFGDKVEGDVLPGPFATAEAWGKALC